MTEMYTLKNSFADHIIWDGPVYELESNQIHVFDIRISMYLQRLDEFISLLSPDEIARANRYFQQKDRERFRISRGMQRIILGKYLNLPACSLQFKLDNHKKPFLLNDTSEIYYNLSHAADVILLVISTAPIGVDVEYINPDFPYQEVIKDHFTQEEISHINEMNSSERFFKLWTRKEAFLKATGQGIGDDLKLYPTLDGEHILQKNVVSNSQNWQQLSFKLDENYISSITSCAGKISYCFSKPD
ncbi:4'-phosphopantetheinyl transferase family protein [Pedobacter frigoris]|uniref:4'-phosphopantetheinyl transferase superfamily protein n=1 Tax=Pedobacter frigoris TaxID=2571272 RepID=A0A4U1CRB3_9SPHI|nr:4'-phosphopantetheinyl transferase superfamily protein [Pedobacter frigoris]TKC09405.1 4'-phosphopantetheinyl transferase superfamily protein [Pedobacter frigoris]